MARARNIKPSLFKNEILGEADPLLTILFEGLWCLADREGRLEDRPKRIKAEIFPYRELPNFNGYLTELERLEFILRYEVDNVRYIQVKNFKKHQSPHKTEKPSVIPEPPLKSDSCEVTEKAPLNNETLTDEAALIPDSLIPDSLSNKTLDQDKLDQDVLDFCFDKFWHSGIRKVGKKKCLPLFARILKAHSNGKVPVVYDFTTMLVNDIQKRLAINQLGFSEMHPTTYLNGERWNDEVKSNGHSHQQSNQQRRPSAVDRVRLANEERERQRQAQERAIDGSLVADPSRDLRERPNNPIRADDARELGAVIEGSFTRTN